MRIIYVETGFWGRDPSKKVYVLSYDVFRTNYYGYIKAK